MQAWLELGSNACSVTHGSGQCVSWVLFMEETLRNVCLGASFILLAAFMIRTEH